MKAHYEIIIFRDGDDSWGMRNGGPSGGCSDPNPKRPTTFQRILPHRQRVSTLSEPAICTETWRLEDGTEPTDKQKNQLIT